MNQTVRFQHVGAVPFFPPFFAWSIAADGMVLSIAGPAEDHFGAEVRRVVGHDYRVAFAGEPAVCNLLRCAMEGQTVAEPVQAWGAAWFTIVQPTPGGGVEGWSLLMPEGVRMPEPAPEPRRRTWELVGVPQPSREPYCDGDLFIKVDGRPGVAVARYITDSDFLALHMEHGTAMRLTADSGSPSSPRLQLVR